MSTLAPDYHNALFQWSSDTPECTIAGLSTRCRAPTTSTSPSTTSSARGVRTIQSQEDIVYTCDVIFGEVVMPEDVMPSVEVVRVGWACHEVLRSGCKILAHEELFTSWVDIDVTLATQGGSNDGTWRAPFSVCLPQGEHLSPSMQVTLGANDYCGMVGYFVVVELRLKRAYQQQVLQKGFPITVHNVLPEYHTNFSHWFTNQFSPSWDVRRPSQEALRSSHTIYCEKEDGGIMSIAACCDCCSSLMELQASVVLEGEGSYPRLIHQSRSHPDPPVPPYTANITTLLDNREHTSNTNVTLGISLVINITYRAEFNGPAMQYLTGWGRESTPEILVQGELMRQHTEVLTIPSAGNLTPRMTQNYNAWLSHTGKLLMVEPTVNVRCRCKYDPTIAQVPFYSVCELPGGLHSDNTDAVPAASASGEARLSCGEKSSMSSSTSTI